jgi:hypothetical protein
MSGPSVEDLLGIRPLTTLIQSFDDTESPTNKFFTSLFEKGEQSRPPGDEFRWDELVYPRGLAPIVGPDSPHPRVNRTDLKVRSSPMACIKLHTDISARRLYKQRAPGSDTANAAAVIRYELKNLRSRIQKSVEKMCAKTLLGQLDVNKKEFEGSDIEFSVKHDVNTWNRGNPWSDPTTQIVEQELPSFTDSYARDSGLLPETAVINVAVEQYLRKNNDLKSFCQNQALAPLILKSGTVTAEVLSALGLGGLRWQKSVAYYSDSTGTLTRFLADNKVILLPGDEDLTNVLGLALGTSWVPRELWGTEGQLNWVETAAGYCAYSETIKSPAGIRLYAEWTGLPYVKFGKGVCIGTIE